MPYVTITTETKPANCSPLFRWARPDRDNNIAAYRKKYYVDTGLFLSTAITFRDSNNQICNANTATIRSSTAIFANQESYFKWVNDPVRKIFKSEKTKHYETHKIETNITLYEE
jgi:hypothetical protein